MPRFPDTSAYTYTENRSPARPAGCGRIARAKKLIDNFIIAPNDDRIRVHSSEKAAGKLFQFVSHLHSVIQSKLAPSRSRLGRRIKSVSYANGAGFISEVAKRQRATLKLLGVPDELFASAQS